MKWPGGLTPRLAVSMLATWTISHLRRDPFPRYTPLNDGAGGRGLLLAPVNGRVLPDAAIWELLRLPGTPTAAFVSGLDRHRQDLMSDMRSWGSMVVTIRRSIYVVSQSPSLSGAAQQGAIHPLAQMGERLLHSLCALALRDCMRDPYRGQAMRLTARAAQTYSDAMSAAANATAAEGSFRLGAVLNYSGRSRQLALASLVGAEEAAIPGRYNLPAVPITVPTPDDLGAPRIPEELEMEFPLETLRELSEDVENLREACSEVLMAFHDLRAAHEQCRRDLVDRLGALETRVPATQTLASVEDLIAVQMASGNLLDRLRARVQRLELAADQPEDSAEERPGPA